MRIAGSTLTFSRGGLAEALAQVAEIGFTEIELAAIEGWAHVSPARLAEDPPGELGRVRQELERHGLRVVAINSGLGGGPPAQREVRGRAVLDLAGRLGAGVVTLPPAGLRAENVRERSGEELALLARLVDAARAAGVVLAVEGHMGGVTEDPASAAALAVARSIARRTSMALARYSSAVRTSSGGSAGMNERPAMNWGYSFAGTESSSPSQSSASRAPVSVIS